MGTGRVSLSRDYDTASDDFPRSRLLTPAAILREQPERETPVTDIPACVAADRRGRIEEAINAVQRQFEKRCVGVDARGLSRVPGIGTDASTIVGAVNDNGGVVVELVYGSHETASAARVAEPNIKDCQAGVTEGLHLCQDAIVVQFQQCVNTALWVGKEPVPEGATTVADLSACIDFDPRGRVARRRGCRGLW
ncbi:MAG: hypothetical protein P8R42_23440 [Candidatus Binatia bacterium]|nr:hypothetical protein [Candidatus Binatia bacterium]